MELDIYEISRNNAYRYALGGSGQKVLYVLGLNPSTATNLKLDPTLKNVKTFSEILGFDAFVMLNLYPQRSTLPGNLHKRLNPAEHARNLACIKRLVKSRGTVWAAWGEPIKERDYLRGALKDIVGALKSKRPRWIQYDDLTKSGQPRHPSRKKHEDRFQPFDMQAYLAGLD